MVVTMLQADVAGGREADLERAYRERAAELPPDIIETFLVREVAEASRYRIVTVWASREALERMRASGVTPTGVLIFQEAGVTPTLTVLEVVVHRDHAESVGSGDQGQPSS